MISGASKPLFGSNAFSTTPSSPASKIFGGFGAAKPTESAAESVGEQKTDSPTFTFKIANENGVNASSPLTPLAFNATSTPATLDPSANENAKSTANVFGGPSGLSFASLAQKSTIPADTSAAESVPNLSDASVSQFSFATLAAQANNSGTTAERTNNSALFNTSGGNAFIGLSNRDDFSNFSGPRNGSATASSGANHSTDNGNDNGVDDANYDPHYEPIIELPDEIEVTTGEENEEKLFGERAKLYRWDSESREWKERGVGELKVLHHPGRQSYRLLLRREQVHRCVLNAALSTDFRMNSRTDKTFNWVVYNFAENWENGELESLSVRFRNAPLAQRFKEVVESCLAQLRGRAELEPEDN